MGHGCVAYVTVGLLSHNKLAQREFERAMALRPEVRECHNVTGLVEYLLRVEVADIAAYKKFHADVLGSLSQVNSITTYMVLDSPKNERG